MTNRMFAYILLVVGFICGAIFTQSHAGNRIPGTLKSTTYECSFCCGKEKAIPQLRDGADCTIVVTRQFCRIIDYPTPHQICITTREEVKGKWNAASACCQAEIDGRKVCVKNAN